MRHQTSNRKSQNKFVSQLRLHTRKMNYVKHYDVCNGIKHEKKNPITHVTLTNSLRLLKSL